MNRDRLKLVSLFVFFILTMSLLVKLYNKEREYIRKEREYTQLLNESRQMLLEADLEKNKVKQEALINERSLRMKILEQEEIIEVQREELKELEEFRDILDTVKKFSGKNMGEREERVTALSVYRASRETRLDWKVISALIMTESSYRANIVSVDPSYGLMQLKLPTANYMARKEGAKQMSARELLDIQNNVEYGSKYLLSQVIKFSSLSEGIMAYNFGPGKMMQLKRGSKRKIESVYLKKVKKYHKKIDTFLEEQRVSMNLD